MPFADGGNNWRKNNKNFLCFFLRFFEKFSYICIAKKSPPFTLRDSRKKEHRDFSSDVFFILKIILRFFDKLFFFAFFVAWN